MKVLAFAIAYNEETKIGRVVEKLVRSGVDRVAVVDDGSTDGTARVAKEGGAEVIFQGRRQGAGAAIRAGFEHARRLGMDVAVVVAGNDKDQPAEIGRLLEKIREGFDLVQGSRFLPGGEYGNMPTYRILATKVVHPLLMSIATGRWLTDTTNGFRAVRMSLLEDPRIDWRQPWLDRYELEPYLLFKTIRLGHRFCEVPVTKIYPPHQLGYTKMAPITGWWSILRPIFLLSLGLRK